MAGSLGHLAATVTLDIDPFKNKSKALMSTIKNTNAALKLQDNYAKAYGNSLNSMSTHYATMQTQMSNYTKKLKEQQATYDKNTNNIKKATNATQAMIQKQQNSASALNKTKNVINQLDAQMGILKRQLDQQSSGWYKAATGAQKFSSVAKSAGESLSSLGSTLTMRVTTPIAAGMGYALKKSIDFQDVMNTNKNLIVTGGESTQEAIRGVANMEKDAKQYSDHYGISQQKIGEGYQELIKRGYTSKQALGAMRSELQASKASGDDFSDVVNVASQTLEAFGMKSNTTAGMTRNTKKAVNELAFAADATSTDFSSLGIGMSYVGSSAHLAGFSLSETASAMGILSNNGLEADKAGTGLRKVINSLVSPTKTGADALEQLGLKTSDFVTKSGKMKSMTSIFGLLNSHMQNLSQHDRMDIFHALFGTTGQQAGAILANNSKELGTLNKKVADSVKNDYVGKLSEKNLKSAKNQIAILKESMTNLGMTMANDLLPRIQPIIADVNRMVQAFSKLDKSTQQSIVKWGLYAAALGPVLSVTGGAIKGLGALGTAFTSPLFGISRMVGASKQGATGLGILKAGFSKTAYESGKFATKAGAAGTSALETGEKAIGSANNVMTFGSKVSGASSSLLALAAANPIATLAIAATTAAVVYGGIKLAEYTKKTIESQQRVNRWGSDVGKSADKSLSKVQNFNVQASQALDGFGDSAVSNGKTASKAFEGIGKEIEKTGKQVNKSLGKGLNDLPPQVRDTVEKSINQQKQGNNKIVSQSKELSSNVADILKTHNGNVKQLTAEQQTYIRNSQQKLNDNEIKLLGITGQKKVAVMKALNGNVKGLTEQQAQQTIDSLEKVSIKEEATYKKQASALKSFRSKGLITEKAYTKAMDQLQSGHKSQLTKNLSAIDKLENDYSARHSTSLEKVMQDEKVSWNDVDKTLSKAQSNGKTKLSSIAKEYGNVGKVAKTAGNDWNHMVLNPKTGKMKTNAQQTINDVAKTNQGWAQLRFDLKHAKIDSNAKSMIGEAAIQSGRWDSLPWKDKKAMLHVQGNDKLTGVVKQIKDWNQLTPEQKNAIVRAKGQKELAVAMINAGEWNKIPLKDKKALVKTAGERELVGLLDKSGNWNNLSLKSKQAIIEGKGNAELVDQLRNLGEWDKLTPKQKELLINNKATAPIVDAMIQAGTWNSLSVEQKDAIIHDKATAKLVQSLQKAGIWNQLDLKTQNAMVNDKATGKLVGALASAGKWQGLDIGAKDAIVNDNASAPIIAALVQSGQWNALPLSEKNAIINTGSSAMDLANLVISYGNFDALSDAQKNLIVNNQSAMTALSDAGLKLQDYNLSPTQMKYLMAQNSDVISKTKTGKNAVVQFNGQQVEIKKLKGNNIDILGKIVASKSAIDTHNSKPVTTKVFKGNAVDVVTKSNTGKTAVGQFNATIPHLKTLKAKDSASGPARSAKSAVDSFPIGTKVMNLVTNFISKHIKKAKGDTDFQGGAAMVNDQPGSTFRELIHLPTGESFVPYGRNVTMALPRHTQIVPATETNRLLGGIPQFANGTPGYSRVIKQFTDLSPNLLQQGDTVTTNNNNRSDKVTNTQEFHFNIVVNTNSTNGTEIGRQTYDEFERHFRQDFNNLSDAQGGGSIA